MKFATWVKRLGFWGFLFFLVKGLLWLLVPALLAHLAARLAKARSRSRVIAGRHNMIGYSISFPFVRIFRL